MEYSWVSLRAVCPIDIEEITKYAESIETIIEPSIIINKLEGHKEKLILASADLEIMITKLISLLYNIDMIKSDIEKGLYTFLKDDLTRYIAMIDEKQNKLLEVHDGEPLSGIGRTSAFKKVLRVALYGIIYNSLYSASFEYNSIKKGENIPKEPNTFLRILFLIMSINLSTLGGLPRLKGIGTGFKTEYKPSSWRALFTKKGEDEIREEYKDRYGAEPDYEFDESEEIKEIENIKKEEEIYDDIQEDI